MLWQLARRIFGLDSLLAPAEDPRISQPDDSAALQAHLGQLQHQLREGRNCLDREFHQLSEKVAELEALRSEALLRGDKGLARRALSHKRMLSAELASLQESRSLLGGEEERLAMAERTLSAAWQSRRATAAVRQAMRATLLQVQEALALVSRKPRAGRGTGPEQGRYREVPQGRKFS